MVSIKTTIAGCQLESAIWNAAGALCTSLEELQSLGQSESGAILSKSCTLEPREGNSQPRYYHLKDPFTTINSTGLANLGYQFYGSLGESLKKYNKPFFISVSGLTIDDNLHIIRSLQGKCHAIELNLSCPNVIGKPQIGYDFEVTNKLLDKLFSLLSDSSSVELKTPIGLKLPPYFDQVHFRTMATIIKKYPISFITCINSLGNGLIVDPINEQMVIKPKEGLGGIGGSPVKPIALSNVYSFRKLLPKTIDVIGCGGIRTGWDAFEHFLVGASAVQVGSQLVEEGQECFQRIKRELLEIMKLKGYSDLNDFRGQIKLLD